MKMRWVVLVGVGLVGAALGGGCSSSGSTSGPDGPARAMARLREPVRNAAEGFVGAEEQLSQVLAGVTDTASARGAMPRMEELLGLLGQHWRALEQAGPGARAEARYAYWERLSRADSAFEAQVGRIKGTPGVGPVLAPLLDKVPRWR